MDTKEKLKNLMEYLISVKNFKSIKNNKNECKGEADTLDGKWDKELHSIIDKIDEDGYIPYTMKALVEDDIIYKEDECDIQDDDSKHVLFPLPHNKEQKEIVNKIKEEFGVVLEGGAGTGKSQTIVNLICHFLSQNKRVLVTSQNNKALEMLYDKIPTDINPLCVSIGNNDIENMKEIELSMKKITEMLSADFDKLDNDINHLEKELDNCVEEQEELYKTLKNAEKVENAAIKYGGKQYKLSAIAKWIKDNETQYSWIEDEIRPEDKCPLTDAKFSRLIYLASNINKDEFLKFYNIERFLYGMPSSQEIVSSMKRFLYLRNNYTSYVDALKEWSISYNVDYDYKKIIYMLDNTEKFLEQIEETWMESILLSSRQSETVRVVLEQTFLRCKFYMKKICNIIKEINCHSVEIPTDEDIITISQKFQCIYKQYEQKGRLNKIFRVLHPECDSLVKRCKVDGSAIESKEQAHIAMRYIEQKYIEECLRKLWNSSISVYGGVEIKEVNLTILSEMEEMVSKLETLVNWENIIKNKISIAMRNIAFLSELDWCKKETYSNLKEGILSIQALNEYESLKCYLLNVKSVVIKMEGFENIGGYIENFQVSNLKFSYEKIDYFKEMAPKFKELGILLQEIKNCPKLIEKILNDDDKLSMLVKYKNFSVAWKWKQFDYILKKMHQFKINDIEEKIEEEKVKEKNLIKDIVVSKSWTNEIKSIGEVEKRSLYACLDAVKRVGKGRGVYSHKYKKLVSREFDVCQNVIPVWIMTLDNIMEWLPVDKDMFDVVIIDEANQCDIFAVSALFRARKAIIVGDENQIAYEAIGSNTERIQLLIDKYLKEIPHSEWFDMKTSLYSTALRVLPQRIVLKEHFRCLPEIIEFSNQLCYSNQIIPLRQAVNTQKIGMPVSAIKVEGERDVTKTINYKEAEAIVNEIYKYCEDKNYNGMTIGVISLLGDAQAEVIEVLLKNKIGEEEFYRRKILCGSAYSFQGDERDIILLSMVVANNVKFNTLTKDSDIRRFNVAVSRAKNKLVLFHSVNLEDLNPECIRAKLLNYCNSFNKKSREINLTSIFESQLQKDVYRIIKENGYEVKTQVLVGKYKIDFVIERAGYNIAIDCNGDNALNVDNWEEEYDKQRCIRSMGWKLFKINGSEFYRNPEEIMNNLSLKIRSFNNGKGIA